MNENWYWRLAQDRQRELGEEIKHARLRQEAGLRESGPAVLKALSVFLLILPAAVIAARVVGKI